LELAIEVVLAASFSLMLLDRCDGHDHDMSPSTRFSICVLFVEPQGLMLLTEHTGMFLHHQMLAVVSANEGRDKEAFPRAQSGRHQTSSIVVFHHQFMNTHCNRLTRWSYQRLLLQSLYLWDILESSWVVDTAKHTLAGQTRRSRFSRHSTTPAVNVRQLPIKSMQSKLVSHRMR
jgi:hypothetical protein